MRPVLIFAAETLNLAEVTRMLEIAVVAKRSFEPVFLSYDGAGRNHRYIEAEGFEIVRLQPQLTPDDVERFWAADRMERLTDFFTDDMLEKRVDAEVALYRSRAAVGVVTGFCLSVSISARLAGVPLVWVAQTTWLHEHARRYGGWPDFADFAPIRLIPEGLRDRMGSALTPIGYAAWAAGLNRIGKRRGLPPFRGGTFLEGDITLYAEPEGFSETPIPPRLQGRAAFIGPLIARLDVPIPDAVRDMPRDKPIIYFAMGSSGIEATVRSILRSFADRPVRVIAPVGELLGDGAEIPDNVIVTGWLPAHEVNGMADISVLHGGIGTLMTACLAGTPIVGIPNGNPEQEWNLGCLVRRGMAVHLHKKRLRPNDVLDAVQRMLDDPAPRAAAKAFAADCAAWDGPENGARELENRLLP